MATRDDGPRRMRCESDSPGPPSDRPGQPRFADLAESLFVWGIWLMMLLAALGLVVKFGSPIPYFDDWNHVPVLSGAQPVTAGWLWRGQGEHRFPVSKGIMLATWRLSGGDVRAGQVLNVLMMGAAAAGLILAARKMRGSMSYTDAFFPLLLLHWGHAYNFLMFLQIFFVSSTFLYCALLSYFAAGASRLRLAPAAGAAACLVLLPLHGGAGVCYTPGMVFAAVCVAVAGIRRGKGSERRAAAVLLGAGVIACILSGAYLVGLRFVGSSPQGGAGVVDSLAAGLRFGCESLGFLGHRAWPLSGVFLAVVCVGGVYYAVRAAAGRSERRERALAMLGAFGAAWTLAAGVGIGRAGGGGAAPHYVTLACPILCALYCLWALYAPRRLGGFVQMVLFFVLCASSTYHVSLGMELGKGRWRATRDMLDDIHAGIPPTGLAGRHVPYWCWDEPSLREGLLVMRDAGIGPFARIQPDPPMKTLPLGLQPSGTYEVTCGEGAWRGAGRESTLSFSLDRPRFVYAIRLRFTIDNQSDLNLAAFEVHWPRRPAAGPLGTYESQRSLLKLRTGPKSKTKTVWVNATIDEFHIRPDEIPFTFRLEEITLLVPPRAD